MNTKGLKFRIFGNLKTRDCNMWITQYRENENMLERIIL